MKRFTLFKFFSTILMLFIMVGCSSNPVEKDPPLIVDEKVDEKESSEPHILEVNLNILNKDVASDSHYIYFVIPGAKETKPGKATQLGKSLPYKINSNGGLLIAYQKIIIYST